MKVYTCGLKSNEEEFLLSILKKYNFDYKYFSENKLTHIDNTYDLYIIETEKNIIDCYSYFADNEYLLDKTIFISNKLIDGVTFCHLFNFDTQRVEIANTVKLIVDLYSDDIFDEDVLNKIVIKGKGDIHFIKPEEILFIEKVNKEVLIHKKKEKIKSRNTLNEISKKLPRNFMSLHKSYIVNINEIESISEVGDRTYEVNFDETEAKALMSRYKAEQLFSKLNI